MALARVWDDAVFPQLRERFLNRPEELLRILRRTLRILIRR